MIGNSLPPNAKTETGSAREVMLEALCESWGPAFGPPERLEQIQQRYTIAMAKHTDAILAALGKAGFSIVASGDGIPK